MEDVKNKLRTLYGGKKTPLVITNIAKTFKALCDYADFSAPTSPIEAESKAGNVQGSAETKAPGRPEAKDVPAQQAHTVVPSKLVVSGLQYHINIVLPEVRDQAVYDAIFRSLREHLG